PRHPRLAAVGPYLVADAVHFDGADGGVHRGDDGVAVGQTGGGDRLRERDFPDDFAATVVLDDFVLGVVRHQDAARREDVDAAAVEPHGDGDWEAAQLLAGGAVADDAVVGGHAHDVAIGQLHRLHDRLGVLRRNQDRI